MTTPIWDISPRGVEWLKLLPPFVWLRHVWGFRRMHRHCGAFTGWTCYGCARDIARAETEAAYDAWIQSMARATRIRAGIEKSS